MPTNFVEICFYNVTDVFSFPSRAHYIILLRFEKQDIGIQALAMYRLNSEKELHQDWFYRLSSWKQETEPIVLKIAHSDTAPRTFGG